MEFVALVSQYSNTPVRQFRAKSPQQIRIGLANGPPPTGGVQFYTLAIKTYLGDRHGDWGEVFSLLPDGNLNRSQILTVRLPFVDRSAAEKIWTCALLSFNYHQHHAREIDRFLGGFQEFCRGSD